VGVLVVLASWYSELDIGGMLTQAAAAMDCFSSYRIVAASWAWSVAFVWAMHGAPHPPTPWHPPCWSLSFFLLLHAAVFRGGCNSELQVEWETKHPSYNSLATRVPLILSVFVCLSLCLSFSSVRLATITLHSLISEERCKLPQRALG